jgi:NADH-quinone oxidoreductase subunit M
MLMIILSLVAVVYIGFVALVQQDMKKLIAYSSIMHMGFVTLGAFIAFQVLNNSGSITGAVLGMQGAMIQMVSHGLVSGALFLCVGVMYDRVHSREISAYGGVINRMPKFAVFMVLFALANTGLPATSGFVGEFLVILASFKASFWYAFLAATSLVLGAAYTLWLVKRVMFGPVANDHVAHMEDLNYREFIILFALAALVILMGVWPQPLTGVMETSLHHLIDQMMIHKVPL